MTSMAPPRRKGWKERDKRWGWFFIAPQGIGLLLFTLIPFIGSFVLGFTEWNGFGMPRWAGLTNFIDQFTDPLLGRAIINTLLIAAITVPIGLALAIIVSVLLNGIRGRAIYLVMFFAPVVTSMVAVAMLWQQLLRRDGWISTAIAAVFGTNPPDWLGDPRLALAAVCMVTIWASLGLNVVIFLAGLQNIPAAVLEAAQIDGAGPIRRMLSIILPMLSPIIFFQSVIAFISSLQTFDLVFVLVKNAGPDNATRTIVYHIYDLGFAKAEFGVSSAASVILLAITLVITAAQFALQKRFVHYEV
ncbi:carbohydrate ABC transporter permease [Brachybacterium timonense]|uniref:carbohydrate ABC transporter permease n=1 Tax=Brachybacterium timonense TaxID=2050896 RepID=UPI000D0AE184|nr:sugar ABC transporter permease [Brachybacterium timonense]